jgi:heat shock protein HtpX
MAVGLNTYIWNNNLRSILLLAFYPFLMLGLLWACGAAAGYAFGYGHMQQQPLSMAVRFGNGIVYQYWPLMLTAVAIWFVISYFFHSSMMRALSHARPVSRKEEPELYNLLENLCISRGLTMPRLEIIETDALNAFASGIDQRSFAITVTRGLLHALNKEELEAVLGHELTHIINRDVRLMMISIIFTGMIGFASQMVWSMFRNMRFSRNRNSGSFMIVMLAIGVILGIGYMATMLTRFALSRRREFMADAGSVELTRNPEGMIRALQRLQGHDRIPGAPADVSLMCICNSRPFMGMFATHPPLEDRISTIAALTGATIPQASENNGSFKNPWD